MGSLSALNLSSLQFHSLFLCKLIRKIIYNLVRTEKSVFSGIRLTSRKSMAVWYESIGLAASRCLSHFNDVIFGVFNRKQTEGRSYSRLT